MDTGTEESVSRDAWSWQVLLFGAVLIAALLWYFGQAKEEPAPKVAAIATTDPVDAPPAPANTPSEFVRRKLPNGMELSIPQSGIENSLIAYIQDDTKPVDKETWFDFDRLLFATASANLQPSSNEQLKNVADILKAFPKVHLRIGGYTDNTGKAEANQKLSRARASSVKDRIAAMGINSKRLEAKGYGEEHPIADNETEAGRARNRRISVRVTQK